ncbi:3,4-dihydroxy-2-butanone-4-phosphate synthase [Nocardia sp. NPDC057353]|uniref:3,4-dihydroxy-2-butanone-4-phosphate synthase n=1 Tax=Nocardia sp. NPDC057353 TaxID=3346104 RepID=UPI0036251C17
MTAALVGRAPTALAVLRRGGVVLVVDDLRGTGSDLVTLASAASGRTVAGMIRHGSGLLCTTVDAARCDRLELPPVNWRDPGGNWYAGAMRVSVDATAGITTGISAHDRAATARVLADPDATPDALRRPGHVIPVLAEPGDANRPALLAELAARCGRPGAAVLFCAAEAEPAALPVLRLGDIPR